MYFNKYRPSPLASKFIDSYFSVDTNLVISDVNDLVVPDGGFGLLFIESDGMISRSPDTSASAAPLRKSCFFGQKTKAVNYKYGKGAYKAFGLKIKPWGPSLFTQEGSVLKDDFESIDAVGVQGLLDLEQEIFEANTVNEKIILVEAFVKKRLDHLSSYGLEMLEEICIYIHKHRGNISLDTILKHYQINYKKVERLFNRYLGIPPKVYIRIIRFNATIISYYQNENESLTRLGIDSGFFDQSHFIKEFKEFTALSPKRFFGKSRSESESMIMGMIAHRWQEN